MTPTKIFDLIPKTAQDLGLDEQLVKDIVEEYYKTLKSAIRNIDYVQIAVPNLGYFYFRHFVADEKLADYNKYKNSLLRAPDFNTKQERLDVIQKAIDDVERGIEMGRLHDARKRYYYNRGKEKYFNSLKEDIEDEFDSDL